MAWTAEQWRAKRAKERDERFYDKDDPFLHPRFIEAGRELQAMMDCPACDWPNSKWAKEKHDPRSRR